MPEHPFREFPREGSALNAERLDRCRAEVLRAGTLRLVPIASGAALLLIALIAFAAEQEADVVSPDWLQLALGLFGGIALFLGGLQLLSEGMKKAAGQAMKTLPTGINLTPQSSVNRSTL